jgi:ADP-ribose pyrophosphatase
MSDVKKSSIVYESDWLAVYEDLLEINEVKDIQTVRIFNKIKTKRDNAVVIPVFSDGSLLMIENYRRGVDKVLLDLPGGLIEENEQPHETARKELLQETGYSCEILESRGWFYIWPSKANQKTYLFLAKKLEKISNQNLEETEKIKIKIITRDEIILMLKNQQILDSGIIAALFYGYLADNLDYNAPDDSTR